MTPEQFAYWMQGIAETSEGAPSEKQWQAIKDHLALVFVKVTPLAGLRDPRAGPFPPPAGVATPFVSQTIC